MSTLLISYDLRKPGRNYEDLYELLRSFNSWSRPLQSVWFVKTTNTVETVGKTILNVVDSNDVVLVLDVHTQSWWSSNIPTDAAEWMKKAI